MVFFLILLSRTSFFRVRASPVSGGTGAWVILNKSATNTYLSNVSYILSEFRKVMIKIIV